MPRSSALFNLLAPGDSPTTSTNVFFDTLPGDLPPRAMIASSAPSPVAAAGVSRRPPTFALFGNQLNALPEHYVRYLQNEIRKSFDLRGVPLRFSLRTSKNPFA